MTSMKRVLSLAARRKRDDAKISKIRTQYYKAYNALQTAKGQIIAHSGQHGAAFDRKLAKAKARELKKLDAIGSKLFPALDAYRVTYGMPPETANEWQKRTGMVVARE